jgi:hypothetical protein
LSSAATGKNGVNDIAADDAERLGIGKDEAPTKEHR